MLSGRTGREKELKMYKKAIKITKFIIWVSIFIGAGYAFTLFNDGTPFEIPSKEDLSQDIESVIGKETKEEVKVTEEESPVEERNEYLPVSIKIESVNIDIPVEIGGYDEDTQTWEIGNFSAYWANLSNLPSEESGNTLIYGHNTWDAFYPLKDIKVGDSALITAETGEILTYKYIGDEIVEPTDDSLFYQNDIPRLTLLTCSGSFSQARRLMYFELVSIENIATEG